VSSPSQKTILFSLNLLFGYIWCFTLYICFSQGEDNVDRDVCEAFAYCCSVSTMVNGDTTTSNQVLSLPPVAYFMGAVAAQEVIRVIYICLQLMCCVYIYMCNSTQQQLLMNAFFIENHKTTPKTYSSYTHTNRC
jgi:hypothetical protein